MKKTLNIIASAVIALAAITSCAKEQLIENVLPAGEAIQVSINGLIGDFTPADATKATAESVVRVTWGSGDKVFVYDGSNASIGTLTVTPDNNNASYAMLSGTITASSASPAPTKLTLVYVKGATEAPTIAGGKISIGLSTQNQVEVPFVLYTTVDYNAAALMKTNEYISFSFATSVMTVNCTGLPTDEGAKIDITKAEIDGVSTACELTIDGSGVTTVAGITIGTITRTGTSVFQQSDSRGSFKLALAADPTAPAARNILVFQDSKVSGAAFTSTTLAAGKSYNTVYQMGEYISNGAGGYAPAVKVTGVTLNKSKTTIGLGATEPLVATVAPANATNKQVNWLSSDTSVATVDQNGKVTGVAEGSANIFATTADGNFTAVCLVTVIPPTTGTAKATIGIGGGEVDVNWVQLWENGPKFAEYNIGAADNKAEDYGGYYAWGGSQDKVDDHNTGSSELSHTGDNITDTATKLWGNSWRMPTQTELRGLIDNCTVENVLDPSDDKKLLGIKITGKGAYESNSVFLPAAGYYDSSVFNTSDNGVYWSSTPCDDDDKAYRLDFTSDRQEIGTRSRKYGYSVRAVLNEE